MKIGTRGSDLATTQSGTVARMLSQSLGVDIELEIIKTRGDLITDRPLRELEGRGYFTKELEEALLDGQVDLAVHSFKDMPSQSPDGLTIAALSVREDPADLLIIHKSAYDEGIGEIPLKQMTTVGTSAVRRQTQIGAVRDDLFIKDLRGNVPTRLRKLSEHQYDAVFLASAGVRRLDIDLSEFHPVRLDPVMFVPSPGQGVLAIQMRENDKNLEAVKKAIHSQESEEATRIERSVLAEFGGGCSLPLGTYAKKENDKWHAFGFWGGNKERPAWAYVSGTDPNLLGDELYRALLKNSK